jgi:hypothetical protein
MNPQRRLCASVGHAPLEVAVVIEAAPWTIVSKATVAEPREARGEACDCAHGQ